MKPYSKPEVKTFELSTDLEGVKLDIMKISRIRHYLSGDAKKAFDSVLSERLAFLAREEAHNAST